MRTCPAAVKAAVPMKAKVSFAVPPPAMASMAERSMRSAKVVPSPATTVKSLIWSRAAGAESLTLS